MSAYEDFPMPAHYPDYPSHAQVLEYFRSYARHFDLYPYIRFNTRVEHAELQADQSWLLRLGDGSVERFDYLLVANGHHHKPRHPEGVAEAFTGDYYHSHDYKHNRPFVGQRVLVIGSGNSGCDCAVEISRVAERVDISIRRAQYIIPKFFLGQPTDTFNRYLQYLPEFMANLARKLALRIQVGRYRDYQLPEPDFPVTAAHPTLNSELLYKIRHGKVHPRPAIAQIENRRVYFKDGSNQEYDAIVAATGYFISLPFFDPDFVSYEHAERVPLYLRMFHPEHPTLIFIGLFQPQGAIWPLSDYQAKLAANYIAGRWQRPANIRELAEADSNYIAKAFTRSMRHTIEVHYERFRQQLWAQIPKDEPAWVHPVEQ